MPEDRKAIIIKEIYYWKEHNLLPAVYCDFLLALYTNGQHTRKEKPPARINKKILIFNIYATVLATLSFIVLYFTQFPSFLQMGFVFFLLVIMFWLYIRQGEAHTHKGSFNYILILLLILILITSVHIVKLFFPNLWISNGIILLNIITWYYIGIKKRYKYLYWISSIALVFMILINLL